MLTIAYSAGGIYVNYKSLMESKQVGERWFWTDFLPTILMPNLYPNKQNEVAEQLKELQASILPKRSKMP